MQASPVAAVLLECTPEAHDGATDDPGVRAPVRGRLRAVPPAAVTAYKQALGGGTYSSQAAVMLIQADAVFDQGRFQQPAFDGLLAESKMAVP